MAFSFSGQHEPIDSVTGELKSTLFPATTGFHFGHMTTLVYEYLIIIIDTCHGIPLGETTCLNK